MHAPTGTVKRLAATAALAIALSGIGSVVNLGGSFLAHSSSDAHLTGPWYR